MLKKVFSIVVIMFAASLSAHAQEIPKVEFAVTYSLLVADIDALDNEAMHGYSLSLQGNINKYFAVVGEWTADHGASGPVTAQVPGSLVLFPEVDLRAQTFLGGPRFTYRHDRYNLYGHYLVGWGNMKVEDEKTGFHTGNGDVAMAVGGGLDIYIGKKVSVRAAQFDYLPMKTAINTRLGRPNSQGVSSIDTTSSSWLHNARFQTGLVFRFGSK